MPRRLEFWLRWWVALFVLYVLLVFKTEAAELVAGAVCAAVAATGAALVRSRSGIEFAPGFRWVRAVPGLAWQCVVETLAMTGVLWRSLRGERVHGRMRAIAFPDARRRGPEAVTRRAVEKFFGSVSPNSFVVGFDERHGVVIVHQLEETEEPPRVDWGAR